jgi:hypothetical protein
VTETSASAPQSNGPLDDLLAPLLTREIAAIAAIDAAIAAEKYPAYVDPPARRRSARTRRPSQARSQPDARPSRLL